MNKALNQVNVAVAGASGYSGQELLKLLRQHPGFKVKKLIGREDSLEGIAHEVSLAFLCTPNEVSLEIAPKLIARGVDVVDVSGVFRLKSHSYSEWYGLHHTAPDLLQKSEYGLYPWIKPPIKKKDSAARLIANPGCYPTATLLALLPLLKEKVIAPESIIVDAKSGTTGAGKKAEAKLMFSEIFGDFAPYKVGKHQHWPEIVEAAASFADCAINPCFVTSLLPVDRGISAAVYGEWHPRLQGLPQSNRLDAMALAYSKHYIGQPDIVFGTEPELAKLKPVVGTNKAHIQFNEAYGKPVVFCVIDNLLRGAAGQALMNANQLVGFETQEGLFT